MEHGSGTVKLYRAIGTVVGVFALVTMFYTVFTQPLPNGVPMAVANFFSYFTNLTNILVVLALGSAWLAPSSRLGRFFGRPSVRAAVALYITVVSVVYYLFLRQIWQPEGLRWLADVLLHYVTPVLFVLDWLLFVPKGRLRWSDLPWWMIYPFAYAAYTLVRGAAFGWYPYPFIDVTQLGYSRALTNVVFFVAVFAVLSVLVIALDRWLGKMRFRQRAAAAQ
jgi:hypothetical protein